MLSVIIPVYNNERYLITTLSHIRNAKYRDLEISGVILISLEITSDNKQHVPEACASIPTKGSPSYRDGNKNKSNA